MAKPVYLLPPPPYSYFKAPHPILSFMYGLYCDATWSKDEFDKWVDSRTPEDIYEYAGYLDPYPGLPWSARKLISVRVPAEGQQVVGGRFLPNESLAELMWPLLLQELTLNPAEAVSAESDPDRHPPVRDANRPVLSGLALIYLQDMSEPQARDAFLEYLEPLQSQLIAVAASRSARGGALTDALLALKPALISDLVSEPAAW
jgi:hypothetical protein